MFFIQTLVKTAAIGGIAFFWINFVSESLELVVHIISPKTIVKQKAASPIVKQKKSCVKAAMAIFWMMGVNCMSLAAMILFAIN